MTDGSKYASLVNVRTSKYTKEILAAAVAQSTSVAGVLRRLGLRNTGGSYAYIQKRISEEGIICSHFNGQAHGKGNGGPQRKTAALYFVKLPEGSSRTRAVRLRRVMIEDGFEYICSKCGQEPFWCGQVLLLTIDHIDGNWLNNQRSNLRFLCPNCHSQTETFGTRKLVTTSICLCGNRKSNRSGVCKDCFRVQELLSKSS